MGSPLRNGKDDDVGFARARSGDRGRPAIGWLREALLEQARGHRQRLRGSLEVSGMDLRGSGDVVKFGQRALRISFTLTVNGSALDANGLGADGSVIGRVHRPPMVQLETVVELHTFSITARDRETGAFGVAVATARPSVGSLVPWVSPRGAIATQARVSRRRSWWRRPASRACTTTFASTITPTRSPSCAAPGGRRRPHETDRGRIRFRGSPAFWPGQVLTGGARL